MGVEIQKADKEMEAYTDPMKSNKSRSQVRMIKNRAHDKEIRGSQKKGKAEIYVGFHLVNLDII